MDSEESPSCYLLRGGSVFGKALLLCSYDVFAHVGKQDFWSHIEIGSNAYKLGKLGIFLTTLDHTSFFKKIKRTRTNFYYCDDLMIQSVKTHFVVKCKPY